MRSKGVDYDTVQDASTSINSEPEVSPSITCSPGVEKPLPRPFPLPENYPTDVEADLAAGSMSCTTTAKFITAIAHKVHSQKRYPTRLDYINVTSHIVDKYLFLKSPVGLGHEHIVEMLRNRFKRFRRKRATTSSVKNEETPPKKTKPLVAKVTRIPSAPPGEDQQSYQRHLKLLQDLYRKKTANVDSVSQLMERTFALRRASVMTDPQPLATILMEHPFLRSVDQLIIEYGRVLEDQHLHLKQPEVWMSKWCSRITSLARKESHRQSVRCVLEVYDLSESDNNGAELASEAALLLLATLGAKKSSASDVVQIVKGHDDISQEAKKTQKFPLVLATDSVPREYFLVAEKMTVGKIPQAMQLPSALLAAYYVFNMSYPDSLNQFYLLLECCLIGNCSQRLSTTTKSLFTTLSHM